jgi:hypothetical protein
VVRGRAGAGARGRSRGPAAAPDLSFPRDTMAG